MALRTFDGVIVAGKPSWKMVQNLDNNKFGIHGDGRFVVPTQFDKIELNKNDNRTYIEENGIRYKLLVDERNNRVLKQYGPGIVRGKDWCLVEDLYSHLFGIWSEQQKRYMFNVEYRQIWIGDDGRTYMTDSSGSPCVVSLPKQEEQPTNNSGIRSWYADGNQRR